MSMTPSEFRKLVAGKKIVGLDVDMDRGRLVLSSLFVDTQTKHGEVNIEMGCGPDEGNIISVFDEKGEVMG